MAPKVLSRFSLLFIQAGTELTTHYKLDMDEASRHEHSRWYFDLWEKFSKREESIADGPFDSETIEAGSKSVNVQAAEGQVLAEAVEPRQADEGTMYSNTE